MAAYDTTPKRATVTDMHHSRHHLSFHTDDVQSSFSPFEYSSRSSEALPHRLTARLIYAMKNQMPHCFTVSLLDGLD